MYKFSTSQIKLHDKKSLYFEVISSLEFEEINKALLNIYPRIDMNKINALIDELSISKIHNDFYEVMLNNRYEKIIKFTYDKLMEKKSQ